MTLAPPTEAAINDALRAVTEAARRAEQCPDTAAARKALSEVRWAVIRAADLINEAERETREAALREAA